jgi:hypothetical protein
MTRRHYLRTALGLLAAAAFTSSLALAEVSVATRTEVDALFSRLSASGCTFYRNGSWYQAGSARDHLEKKYNYLANKNLIATTEDFIRLGGSESSMSHEAYQVRCGEVVEPSQAWLTRELGRIRTGGHKSVP